MVKEELEIDDTLQMRTKWEIDDITKLLELSIETFFLDSRWEDLQSIGKSISKPLVGILYALV